jgi:type IV pilus assembly protein PilV
VTMRRAGRSSCAGRVPRVRLREAGFSLVEVLVAMFIVAMGILALAGLLQAATRYSKMSELRSTATLLANDIADRIRANPMGGAVGPGGYDLTDAAFPSPLPPPPHAPCTASAPCGPVDLARVDLAVWTTRVRATLPRGSARIQFHAARPPAPGYVDVWVGWADPLTLSPGGASADRSATECPDVWKTVEPAVRCVYLQVAP